MLAATRVRANAPAVVLHIDIEDCVAGEDQDTDGVTMKSVETKKFMELRGRARALLLHWALASPRDRMCT